MDEAGKPVAAERAGRGSAQLHKGDVLNARISSLASGGEGVCKDFGLPIFVARCAPGDLVQLRLFDVRKDFARGEIVQLLEPSAQRAEPPCKIFKVCGGCQWQHIAYQHQLEAKSDIVRQALKHIGKLPADVVQNAIGAVDPLFYRNKVQFPVDSVRSTGRILAGYYKQNSHELVNIKHCPVQPEPLDRALAAAKDAIERQKFTTYDEKSGRGLVRHIAQRYSFATNRVLLTLVINAQPAGGSGLAGKLAAFAQDVMESVPEVVGVCVNYNAAAGNRIIGDTTEAVAGDGYITEVLRSNLPNAPYALKEGIQYRLGPTSFFQVNSKQAAVLLDQVLIAACGGEQAMTPQAVPLLIDAYAGVGTMALWLAGVAGRVIAIEEHAAAVDDGRINASLNGSANVEFIHGRFEDEAPKLAADGLQPSVVVVDPPRKGLHPRALASIVDMNPGRIVYVSCNPATLARDLRLFADSGYMTKRVQPVDMFPQTYHIESVTLLEKSGS